MQKQGPPEALSEAHFANLKRKKGLPVDDIPVEEPYKRRRTAKKPEKSTKGHRGETSKKDATLKATGKQANGAKKAPGASATAQKAGTVKSKKAPAPDADSDEEMGDEFDISNLDDVNDSDLDDEKLGSDFLGSDDSVYDSDQEGAKKEKFVFSDDEDDEDDREERLTAANIEGLSKKLDEKLAQEAEENEAELRDGAMQTNIDGDKPNILGDDDDDDELAAKTQSLLAPDLQMLRTRITETIRVLEDFSNLAEEGRSRPEYTGQLLKDVCACMCSILLPPDFSISVAITGAIRNMVADGNSQTMATTNSWQRSSCKSLIYPLHSAVVRTYMAIQDWLLTPHRNLFTPREAFAFFEANEVRHVH
jgi:ribosomal RNA methyltransferase Nop2